LKTEPEAKAGYRGNSRNSAFTSARSVSFDFLAPELVIGHVLIFQRLLKRR
jgi:hypothetical protein